MDITITSSYEGRILRDWLINNNFSTNQIKRLKNLERGILINGEHATVRYILKSGDVLSLQLNDENTNPMLIPTKMPLEIIYEDDNMLAVNKSAGIPTHPSHGHFDDTLANGLAYIFEKRGEPFIFRAVNRLDRGTSGIVLIAKTSKAAFELGDLMQNGKIQKTYLAIVNGSPSQPSGIINKPIRRVGESIITREVCDENALSSKQAVTKYYTELKFGDHSLIRAEPITGRTHQIRVHLAYIGCPIAGDWLYGTSETKPTETDKQFDRPALHCRSLKILFNEKALELYADLPNDFLRCIGSEQNKISENISSD